jgi:hypothetical protein
MGSKEQIERMTIMKRTQKFRYIILGMMIMAIFSMTAFPALAASTSQQITAYFNNIKIYIDDELIHPADSAGNTVEPFVYNETTYLPVRAVADALGKAVVWDETTNSVYLGKHNSDIPAANLADMDDFYSTNENRWQVFGGTGEKDNVGNMHEKGVKLLVPSYIDGDVLDRVFLLNQKYTRFTGNIAITYKDKNETGASGIKIYGDEKLLYTSPMMTAGSYPVDFSIDVTNVIQLKIEWYDTNKYSSPNLLFSGLNLYS